MKDASRSPPTNLFTLRLWQESLDDERYFCRWEEIAALVPEMILRESDY